MAERSPIPWSLTALICIAALLAPGARIAAAHAFPERAEPRVGAVVRGSPGLVRIWFDGELEPAFCQLVVADAGGRRVDQGDARVDPGNRRLIQVSVPALSPGTYSVHWAVLSIDGHRTTGDYRFTVKGTD
jgi:methionine-rich copper-binding protein CopC